MTSQRLLFQQGSVFRRWLPLLALTAVSGCGGISAEVQEDQDAQNQEMYEEAITNPPNLSPAAAQRRKERVEMDFGISPDDEDEQPK